MPHNWFGSGKFLAPKYSIATGKQECDVSTRTHEIRIQIRDKTNFRGGAVTHPVQIFGGA